jgi:hypothetical protein
MVVLTIFSENKYMSRNNFLEWGGPLITTFTAVPLTSQHPLEKAHVVASLSSTKLPNSEQSYKGKVKTHNYINKQNQSITGKPKTVMTLNTIVMQSFSVFLFTITYKYGHKAT